MARDATTPIRSDQLRAILNPVREHALELLSDTGPLTATALARELGVSPSLMSWHLRQLEAAGLVARTESQDGRQRPWRSLVADIQLTEWRGDLLPELRAMLTSAVDRAYVELGPWADDRSAFWNTYSRKWYSRDEVERMRDEITRILDAHGSMERRDGDDVRVATFFLGAKVDE